MWQSLHDVWWRLATLDRPRTFLDALACRVLQTGAAVYRAAVALRNTAYDRGWAGQVRLPCRVVSVGNLTVGGTGKTACVELITSVLARQGPVVDRHAPILPAKPVVAAPSSVAAGEDGDAPPLPGER